jgi:uncharacterized protein YrzB (UPF0473 family)
MDHENELIELTGENGDTIKCEYLDTVLMDDEEYVVLLPVNEEGCSCCSCGTEDEECVSEVIIMKIEKSGEEEYLVPVEDEQELERAFELFQEQIEEDLDDEEDIEDLQ